MEEWKGGRIEGWKKDLPALAKPGRFWHKKEG